MTLITLIKEHDMDLSNAPHDCGFESRQGLWILSCEVAQNPA
jgi:hypothetical protein